MKGERKRKKMKNYRNWKSEWMKENKKENGIWMKNREAMEEKGWMITNINQIREIRSKERVNERGEKEFIKKRKKVLRDKTGKMIDWINLSRVI